MTQVSELAQESTSLKADSALARRVFHELIAFPPDKRNEYFDEHMDDGDKRAVFAAARAEGGSPYALWQDDPTGFAEIILGETTWSKQREILRAIPIAKKIAVPAAFGVGKTHIGAVGVAWFCSVWPVGTALAVTTATRFRQVQRQLWPHVRRLHAKAGLVGECDMTQWKMPSIDDVETTVAYGFTAPEHDESAMQGIHAPKVFLVVDEAGGFSRIVGSSTRNLLTGDATMLAIGNPATDDEGSWFESLSEEGMDADRTETITIRIRAKDSPVISGEVAPICKSCPSVVPEHRIGVHLVDQDWVDDAVREHGLEAPYVVAKVDAEFPKGGASRAIPASYIENAMECCFQPDYWEPEDYLDEAVSVDRHGTPYTVQPTAGADVRLGVDVAADGGDEFVIARCEGDIARIRLKQSGAANENPTDVAGKILEEIHLAQELADALGSQNKVRVKVDAIGIGWGVVGILEAWGSEGLHDAVIVRVVVSEVPDRPDDKKAQWRPFNKRAEMWLNGRQLFQPDPNGRPHIRLDITGKTAAQLRGPEYGTNAGGKQVIETKKSMKDRGLSSPDQGEAILLCIYEPRVKKKARVLA